jgi:serine/threonine protein kinase
MGRVYLANDTRLANRPVAVKEMIVGEGLQEKKAIEDFAREARVLAPLSHPGIPNLIDYFVETSRHYLVMEYIDGGDLQSWLDSQGPNGKVPESKVLRWGRQILDVLSFLHAQKPPIVYRDLKPANIMIDKNGRAMLIDFGIARFLPPGGRGTQIGSVGYAPPEQYLGKMEARSDLYSLAATMHHLLTGRDPQLEPPFSFPTVRSLAPRTSIATEAAIMKALDKDIALRPASAREMMDALPVPGPQSAGIIFPVGAAMPSTAGDSTLADMRTVVLGKKMVSKASPARPPAKKISHLPTGPSLMRRAVSIVSVSSTAKTKDLGKRPKPSAASSKPAPRVALSPVNIVKPLPAPSRIVSKPSSNGRQHGFEAITILARLVGKTDSLQFALSSPNVIVGRALDPADTVDIDLSSLKSGSDRISRRHAEIIKRGGDYFIRDLGSLNGTFIRGRGKLGRDQLYPLKDHDQVMFGSATFEFRKG